MHGSVNDRVKRELTTTWTAILGRRSMFELLLVALETSFSRNRNVGKQGQSLESSTATTAIPSHTFTSVYNPRLCIVQPQLHSPPTGPPPHSRLKSNPIVLLLLLLPPDPYPKPESPSSHPHPPYTHQHDHLPSDLLLAWLPLHPDYPSHPRPRVKGSF